MFAFRAQLGTESVCVGDQLGCKMPKKSRCTSACVPGRFPFGQSKPIPVAQPYQGRIRPNDFSGLGNKHWEIRPNTTEVHRIPRHNLGSLAKFEVPTRKANLQNTVSDLSYAGKRQSNPNRLAKSYRDDELRELCCTKRATPLSRITGSGQQTLEDSNDKCPASFRPKQTRAGLVATESQTGVQDSPSVPDTLPYHRCKRHWLGSQAEQPKLTRHMVTFAARSTLQPERDDRYFKRLKRSLSAPEFEIRNDTDGQQVRCFIPSQRRRYEVCGTHEPNERSVLHHGSIQHQHLDLSHPRELQLPCRSLISPKSSTGVAPTPTSDPDSIQEVGHACSGSVRIIQGPCSRSILHTGQNRQDSLLLRRSKHDLELSTSMGVPTATPCAESSCSSELRIRGIPNGCATLGKSILEAGSKEQSPSSTFHNQEPVAGPSGCIDGSTSTQGVRNDTRSLEMWGWNEHLTNWTEEQKQLISSSWRVSTLNTYRPAWNRWLAWTRNTGVDTYNPNGSDLARYVADLHQKDRLSLSTILVHKSVVTTFSNPNSQTNLSSHSLVKHVLKAIALSKPQSRKPPVWDTDIITQYLKNKDPATTSLYETSKRTAAILLLCSGRRVHDLTLLSISPENYKVEDDYIILRPVFGSKTDTADHRQSGWKLMTHAENKAICPVYWVKRLIELSQTRREAAKSDSLFLAITGASRPASRTIIGGWIKKLLHEAGINATAGSFRSAVASKNWIENFQLDDILARGNWKSANTFRKFYCREIVTVSGNKSSVTSSFAPADD